LPHAFFDVQEVFWTHFDHVGVCGVPGNFVKAGMGVVEADLFASSPELMVMRGLRFLLNDSNLLSVPWWIW
jgi:hypothetical protein